MTLYSILDHLISKQLPAQISIKTNPQSKGKFMEGGGMKSTYLGAFTRIEIEFIKSFLLKIESNLNPKTMSIIHAKDVNGLINKSDIHLFCGGSEIGTYRVDINESSKANIFDSVQNILEYCKSNNIRFDLIIIDPPYNARYDRKYGTTKLNRIDDGSNFLDWLINSCLEVLNPNGFIISKNWRSIRPALSEFISGMITTYGGFRRLTLLEAWQYQPSVKIELSRKTYNEQWNRDIYSINWILGQKDSWNRAEKNLIHDKIKDRKGILIANNEDKLKNFKEADLEYSSVDEFVEKDEKFDLIVLDDCARVGGAVKLTVQLKTKISENLAVNGIAILKTYFNPVLESKGLNLISKTAICYDNFDKINLVTIYDK